MSLIIEGMKMPEYRDVYGDGQNKCVYLLMLNVRKDGTAILHSNNVGGGFFQVKEVPSPHGRLIDADKLLESFREAIDEDNHFVNFFSLVDDAPTIIEAEVGEQH